MSQEFSMNDLIKDFRIKPANKHDRYSLFFRIQCLTFQILDIQYNIQKYIHQRKNNKIMNEKQVNNFEKTTKNSHAESNVDTVEKQYLKIGSFSFRNLIPKYKKQALNILSKQFDRQEPLTVSYDKKYSSHSKISFPFSLFFSYFMEEAVSNNLSIAVFDTNYVEKLIAVFVCKDLAFTPQAFIDTFYGDQVNAHTYVLLLEIELRKQFTKEMTELFNEKDKIADFWSVAIDKDYVGSKVIFTNMLVLAERVAKESGFTYGHLYATNQKTNIVARKRGFQMLATIDAKEAVLNDQIPFSQVEDFHRFPSIWLKQL